MWNCDRYIGGAAVQGIASYVLRNRLILLHHFSELFCPCIPMFDLERHIAGIGANSVSQSDLLRAILVSSAKVTCVYVMLEYYKHIDSVNPSVFYRYFLSVISMCQYFIISS